MKNESQRRTVKEKSRPVNQSLKNWSTIYSKPNSPSFHSGSNKVLLYAFVSPILTDALDLMPSDIVDYL